MGRHSAIAVLLAVASLASAQDAFPPATEDPGVGPSETATELARQTVERLNALHYRISGLEVPGFVAAYSVKKDSRPYGTVHLSWKKEGDELRCRYPGILPEGWRSGIAEIVANGFRAVLLKRRDARDVAAERRDGRIVLDQTVPGKRRTPETKKLLLYVAEDLLSLRRVRWYASGTVREETLTSEIAGGRTCVTSYVLRQQKPGGVRRTQSFGFQYGVHEGHVFPGQFTLDVIKGDTTVALTFTLDTLEFRAPEPLPEPAPEPDPPPPPDGEPVIPGNAAAAQLARDTVDRLNAQHYSLLRTDCPGFVASFSVARAGFPLGSFHSTWSRDPAQITVEAGPGLSEADRKLVQDLASYGLHSALLENWRSAGMFAVREGARILLEVRGAGAIPDPEVRRAVFSFDDALLECGIRKWRHEGDPVEDRSVWVRAGETAYISTQHQSAGGGTGLDWTFKYCHRDGRVFVKRIRVKVAKRDGTESWEFVLKDVKFRSPVEEVAPDPEGEALAKDTLRRAEEIQYALVRSGVKGFDAQYDMHWKGYSAGGLRFRWNLAADEYMVDHVGAVPARIEDEFVETNHVSFEEWVRVHASGWVWDAVALLPRPDPALSVRARRIENEIIILGKARRPESELRLRALRFTPAGLLTSREERYKGGLGILCEFRQEKAEGKYLRRTTREVLKDNLGLTWNRTVDFTYRRVEGALFPSRIEVRTDPAAPHMDITETILVLEEVKLLR